jgi:glycosyltransferase involved in cell wall biosynthesis
MVVEQLRRRVPGGIGTYAEGVLKGLRANSAVGAGTADLQLLASRPGPGPDPLGDLGWPVRSSTLPGPALTRAWDLGLVGGPTDCQVLHLASLAGPRRRHRTGPPAKVVTVHDLAWEHVPEATTPRGRRWHRAALARALADADRFVVPSAPVRDDLVRAGAPADAVELIPGGADHLPPPDRPGAAHLLADHGVSGPYLLAVGTLEPRKNLRRVVEAFTLASPRLPDRWPLVVVGPPGWGSSGIAEGKPPAAAPRPPARPPGAVVPVGRVNAPVLAGLYEAARLLAYVPLFEGYGLPPLEAMRVGVPVVASTEVPSVTGSEEPVAVRVDPRDVPGLARALVAAATDEDLRRALVAAGHSWVARRTWRHTAAAHLALWEGLA